MKKYLNALSGLSEDEIDTFFNEIAVEMMNGFNSKITSRLKDHAKSGFYTMIVSGAFTPILEAAVRDLPVDRIIGTDVPIKNDTFQRNSEIYHIQDVRKKVAVHDFLKGNEVDWENSYAYGDSYSDLSVMDLVGNPIAVRPDEQLRELAVDRRWEIID